MKNKIYPYNPKLKQVASTLRINMTLSEVFLWLELKGKKMMGYDFHRQKPIGDYIGDFYCPALELIIEIDGDSHIDKYKEDLVRQKKMESWGLTVIRFDDLDVKNNLEGVLKSVKEKINNLMK